MPEMMKWKQFFRLNQLTQPEYRVLGLFKPDKPDYHSALQIEVARQIGDGAGMPLSDALKLVSNVGVGTDGSSPPSASKCDCVIHDHWIGIIRNRNTWGSEPRGSYPVTTFGDKEYWSSAHVSGPLHECVAKLSYWMARDESQYPDSDPAVIVLANVSAADRRLRKRAEELGITTA